LCNFIAALVYAVLAAVFPFKFDWAAQVFEVSLLQSFASFSIIHLRIHLVHIILFEFDWWVELLLEAKVTFSFGISDSSVISVQRKVVICDFLRIKSLRVFHILRVKRKFLFRLCDRKFLRENFFLRLKLSVRCLNLSTCQQAYWQWDNNFAYHEIIMRRR
jgi:hypothetical protein